MQNEEGPRAEQENKFATTMSTPNSNDWSSFVDDDIVQQQSAIHAEEAGKIPFVEDKEYILVSQDKAEVDRRKTLQNLGYAECTFEDFFALFLEQLESLLAEGNEASISDDELLLRCRDQSSSDYEALRIFRAIYHGSNNASVVKFCNTSVEPMGEESGHVHITALLDALGVPVRVVHLDRSSCDPSGGVSVNYHDFVPAAGDLSDATSCCAAKDPYITSLYHPGHSDILYRKLY